MMSRSNVLGLQLSARHGFENGKVSKAYLDCVGAIDPDSFSANYRGVMERLLTPDEVRFTDAFWESETGARLAELAEWAQYHELGLQPPRALKPLSDSEQAAADLNNKSVAGRKLYDWAVKLNGRMELDVDTRARSLILACRSKTR